MDTTQKIKELLKEPNHSKLESFIKTGVDLSDVSIIDIILDENSTHDTYKLLIEHGIELDTKGENDKTILTLACMHEDIQMVKLLVKYGANINIPTKDGFMPISFPIIKGNYQLVKYLIEAGADINFIDNGGFSPLLSALSVHESIVFDGEEEIGVINKVTLKSYLSKVPKTYNKIAKLLIDNGADVNYVNKQEGYTPYSFALKSNNKEMMTYLIKNGAKTINIYSKDM